MSPPRDNGTHASPRLFSHRLARLILPLMGGLVFPYAFAPYAVWPLAVVALCCLFLAWSQATARQAIWIGGLYGSVAFGTGIAWLHISFGYSHVALPLAVVMTAGVVLVMAGYFALLGYLVVRFRPHSTILWLLLMVPAAWVMIEWVRGWLFTGFPWLQAGYALLDSPLSGFVPVFGVLGMTWLTALLAASLCLLLLQRLRVFAQVVAVVIVLGLVAYWLEGRQWVNPASEPRKVALLQGNIDQSDKWQPAWRQPTLQRYKGMTEQHLDADLVIWPETAVPAFKQNVEPYLQQIAGLAEKGDMSIVLGLPVYNDEQTSYYNSLLSFGSKPMVYHKEHLVPFGEYLPLSFLFGWIVDILKIPLSQFSAGDEYQPLMELAGMKASVTICYEGIFGAHIRQHLPGASVLVNVSNDAWFGRSIAGDQHLQMIRMRALETGRYVLRATNTGITVIIDPMGKVVKQARRYEPAVLTGTFTAMQGSTPYVRWGDRPILMLAMLLLIVVPVFAREHENANQ